MIPKFTKAYLVAAIAGLVTLVISIACCIRQMIGYSNDRKKYQSISKEAKVEAESPVSSDVTDRFQSPDHKVRGRKHQRTTSVATDAGLMNTIERGKDDHETIRTSQRLGSMNVKGADLRSEGPPALHRPLTANNAKTIKGKQVKSGENSIDIEIKRAMDEFEDRDL